VQRTLTRHLRLGTKSAHPPDTYWRDLTLDLTNAVLADLDLAECHLLTARFTGARFRGATSFRGARFARVIFDSAEFDGDAMFEQIVVRDDARFRSAQFVGSAVFEDARFDGDARFDAARFIGPVVFTGSWFGEDVRFTGAEFSGDAEFDRTTFTGLARFGQARFFDGVRFRETRFKCGQDTAQAPGLGAMLLEQEPCWVRTDITAAVAPRRVWPAGWTVRPTLDQPTETHGGRWGRLLPARLTSLPPVPSQKMGSVINFIPVDQEPILSHCFEGS
jgi:Pentapeptide repeats (9 copies)